MELGQRISFEEIENSTLYLMTHKGLAVKIQISGYTAEISAKINFEWTRGESIGMSPLKEFFLMSYPPSFDLDKNIIEFAGQHVLVILFF